MDLRALRPPVEDGPWPPITHVPPISGGVPAGARSWVGLSYALVDGYRPMVLDLHVPLVASAPPPVVIWVHGGGWATGDRRHVPLQWGQVAMLDLLISRGMAVATVDHRLIREATPQDMVHDLVAALRYLRRYAGELEIDPDRMAWFGDSAGAHLAAVAGLAGSAPEPDQEVLGTIGVGAGRADVRAIVYFYGASDLTVFADDAANPGGVNLLEFLWPIADPQQRRELARRYSPVSYLRPDSPPVLIVQGDADTMSPVDQAHRFHAAAERVGARSELVIVPGAEHVFLGTDPAVQWQRAADFLAAELDGTTRRTPQGSLSVS